MTNLFFECEWVIDLDKTYGDFSKLIDTVITMNIALTFDYTSTVEGYMCMKFIVRVPSKEILDDFVTNAASEFGLTPWVEIDSLNWPGFTIHPHPEMPMLYYTWKDEMQARGSANKLLTDKLKSHEPTFYECNWRIPSSLSEDWLHDITSRFHATGILGSELRCGKSSKNQDGFYTILFTVRLYSPMDLTRFLRSLRKIGWFDTWNLTTKEVFLECVPIGENTRISNAEEAKLNSEIPILSQANANYDENHRGKL